MVKQLKLKFHYNQHHFLQIPKAVATGRWRVRDWLLFVWQIIYHGFFWIGSKLIAAAAAGLSALHHELHTTKTNLKARKQKLFRPGLWQNLSLFGSGLSIILAVYLVMQFLASGFQLKDQIMASALFGSRYLNQAKTALGQQDLAIAGSKFSLAYDSFYQGQQQLGQTQILLRTLLDAFPAKQKADRFLAAALAISDAGSEAVNFYQNFNQLKLDTQGLSASVKMTDLFSELQKSLDRISRDLTTANQNISELKADDLPPSYRDNFVLAKMQLASIGQSLTSFGEVFQIIKNIALGDKKILILFENNNELRPTGGFMGTFGAAKLRDGKILQLNISSIYDLDGQLKEKITPPYPILNVNPTWYLRDSNWFADFPQSARKISLFYEKEGGETPDLIFAMTPSLIVDSLKITGPIAMPRYGITLDENNFIELIQAVSTQSDNSPTNNPKQVLADFVPIFLQKLQDLPKDDWQSFLMALQNNLQEKHILAYARDAKLQQQFDEFNWAGSIKPSDRDYLSIVSANLNGTKTDLSIEQTQNLTTTIDLNGDIIDELVITRSNKWPNLPNLTNQSFVRILVPENSVLVANQGFDRLNLDRVKNPNYNTDSDVANWEQNSVQDLTSGTFIGKEAGKTFFANWLTVAPGETKTVKLTYRLPFKLLATDRFSLLLQKQPGTLNQSFRYGLNFPGRKLAWKNFDQANISDGQLTTNLQLNRDYLLGGVFTKP